MTHAEKVAHWRDAAQLKLMSALDAAWRTIESSDDPAQIRKARDKARACGDLAACVRKVAGLSTVRAGGAAKAGATTTEALAAQIEAVALVGEAVGALPTVRPRKLVRLKAGRGRL